MGDTGGLEVLVQESGVRLVGAVQDRHPFERHTGRHGIDDAAHDCPDLVVGIRRAHDFRTERRLDARDLAVVQRGTDPGEARSHRRVGAGNAGHAGDHRRRDVRCELAEQSSHRCAPSLRQEAHDRSDVAQQRRSLGNDSGRDAHEIVLVVPVAREQRFRRSMDPDHLVGAHVLRGEHVELLVVEVGELAVRRHQRLLGGRMRGDRREDAGRPAQHPAHRRGDHGRRHRPAPRGRAPWCGQQLGEPVHGEERDTDDTPAVCRQRTELAGREQAARSDTDGVRRHDDGDGRERLVVLGARHGVVQALRRGAAVRGPDDGDAHAGMVRAA